MGLGLLRVSLDLARELGDPMTQIKPLNNLVSFLATRDLRASRGYAEEGLALVRRLGDKEWGLTLIGSAVHTYWNIGEWDALLELVDEIDYDVERSPVATFTRSYALAVQLARGETPAAPDVQAVPSGIRTDVVLDAGTALLESFSARLTGDVSKAADRSRAALLDFNASSGVDDDFPIFWVTALDDRLELGDVDTAREMLAIVANEPRGHVPPLVRALYSWLEARVAVLAGEDGEVGAQFAAAAETLRDFGTVFPYARALLDHAEWLTARDRGDEALALANQAEEVFSRLRAQPWVERCRRLTAQATLPA
jgi:hypothetical protein